MQVQSTTWSQCKKILCIRADNMGDVIMTTPALRALKESFGCHLTVLTSGMGQGVIENIPEIDDAIVFDLPWVKNDADQTGIRLLELTGILRTYDFDATIIFTVYSQSALPAAMLAMMAGIPLRLAYSRENPYGLLTDWIPDKEPYTFVQHQVQRDLKLVNAVGAGTENDLLSLSVDEEDQQSLGTRLAKLLPDQTKGYIVFHPGVSEEKRQYPLNDWLEIAVEATELGLPILLTGTAKEKPFTAAIAKGVGKGMIDLGGELSAGEFIALIAGAAAIVSVNTATIHIAAAFQIPTIVLYALTNPQHTPWKTYGKLFYWDVPEALQSQNEVIGFVREQRMVKEPDLPKPAAIAAALKSLLTKSSDHYITPDALIRH